MKLFQSMRIKEIIILSFITSTISFAQEVKVVEIESGITQKKYENNKLKDFTVSIFAVNYGNTLFFIRNKNEILIENGEDKNSIIKLFIENKKLIKTFIYKKKEIIKITSIDLDFNNLPKNEIIISNSINDTLSSFTIRQNLNSIYESSDKDKSPDKSLKLFYGLDIPPKVNTIYSVFNYLGDFFSAEDALLKIFHGRYRESIENKKDIKNLNYFETNNYGKIKQGILWKVNNKNSLEGTYEMYSNEKIIKSENVSSEKFQDIIKKYLENYLEF